MDLIQPIDVPYLKTLYFVVTTIISLALALFTAWTMDQVDEGIEHGIPKS